METFSALLAICAENSPVPVNSPHKGQLCGALMFTLICARINGWVNNREAGDLRRYRSHYDVIVMRFTIKSFLWTGFIASQRNGQLRRLWIYNPRVVTRWRPRDTCTLQYARSSLVEIMAFRLIEANYYRNGCWLNVDWQQNSMKFESEYNTLHTRNRFWICLQRNGINLIAASMCWYLR